MKRVIYGICVTAIVAGTLYVFNPRKVAVPSNWPKDISRSVNAVTGSIRVSDESIKKTLFWYYDDQEVNPVSIEKTADGEWIVKFKKRD